MRTFRIAQVASILSVHPHVIRYWEEQIPMLRPHIRRNNRRVYTMENIRMLARVKHLVIDQKYTVEGAYKRLLVESKDHAGIMKPKFEKIKHALLTASITQREQLYSLERLEKTLQELQHLRTKKPI